MYNVVHQQQDGYHKFTWTRSFLTWFLAIVYANGLVEIIPFIIIIVFYWTFLLLACHYSLSFSLSSLYFSMNSLWNLLILSNMGTSLSSGGRIVSLQWENETNELLYFKRPTIISYGYALLASTRLKSRQLSAQRATIHRKKKDGGCTFYHDTLRTKLSPRRHMERYGLMAVVPTLTALLLSSLNDLQFFFVFLYALLCAKHYR